MCNTQDAYAMRGKLGQILGLPVGSVRVQYWEGASTFGNSPARYDAGEAAAVISQHLFHDPLKIGDFTATARLYHHGRLAASAVANGSTMLSIEM